MVEKFQQWNTVGHASVKRILELQLKSQNLPHAYFFSGPAGVGKHFLAQEFAKKILQSDRTLGHPDFQNFEVTTESGIAEVREFISTLAYKPSIAAWRVSIINNVQLLNEQSLNALLKTLEEPPAQAVLILISSASRSLPTIMSRCQSILFYHLTAENLETIANNNGWKVQSEKLAAAFGSAGKLEQLCTNPDEWQQVKARAEKFTTLAFSPTSARLLAVNEFAEAETSDLQTFIEHWLYAEVAKLKHDPTAGQRRLSALLKAHNNFKTNKNKKMVLQELFLSL